MNKYSFIKLICLSIVFLVFEACNTDKSSENSDNLAIENTEKPLLVNTNMMDKILNSSHGARIENIGKNIENIKNIENLKVSDSTSVFTTFTQELNATESDFVDVQYFHKNSEIYQVNFDIFLENDIDSKILFDQFIKEFSNKYKLESKNNKEYIWKMKNGFIIELKDVSVKLAAGLQLKIYCC